MRVKINSVAWENHKCDYENDKRDRLLEHYPMLEEFDYEFNENTFESTIELGLLADLKGLIKLVNHPIICWDDGASSITIYDDYIE